MVQVANDSLLKGTDDAGHAFRNANFKGMSRKQGSRFLRDFLFSLAPTALTWKSGKGLFFRMSLF
jgi:hypothetical protein